MQSNTNTPKKFNRYNDTIEFDILWSIYLCKHIINVIEILFHLTKSKKWLSDLNNFKLFLCMRRIFIAVVAVYISRRDSNRGR